MMRKILLLLPLFMSFMYSMAQEICDNGIDDNNNGLVDLNDPACGCDGFGEPQTIPSLVPNPSFEDRNCCPNLPSQLNCADTWIQATTATSDYFNCGYNFEALDDAGITAADGDGFVGAIFSEGWKEYVGSCLLSPMLAGETYTLSFNIASSPMGETGDICEMTYGDVDVSIFGAENCASLPVNTLDCPTSASADWSLLGSITYSPSTTWDVVNIEFTPTTDINAIMIGPPCVLPPEYQGACYAYFVFDNLILANTNFFNTLEITEQGDFCSDDLTLEVTAEVPGGDWQWYYEGVAIVGETNSTLDVSANGQGPGEYNARYTIGTKCEIANYTLDPPQYPVADFDYLDVCLGSDINFIDASTIDLTGGALLETWEWDLGDGNTSVDQNPVVNYPNPGTYDVELNVSGNNGCESSITKTIVVHSLPFADFDFDTVCLGNTNNLFDLSSENGGTPIDSWVWGFDDGNTDNNQNTTHTYATSGTYEVSLNVTSVFGCTAEKIHDIIVHDDPTADYEFNNECFYEPLLFNNTSSSFVNEFEWDFGDGNTSSLESPTHLYSTEGAYDVNLVVSYNGFCQANIEQTVYAYAQPIPSIQVDTVCLGEKSIFLNNTTIANVDGDFVQTWNWDFGDGTSSNIENPTNMYADENVYTIQLFATSNFGCKDSVEIDAVVWPLPIVDFTPTSVCLEEESEFTDLTTISNDHTNNTLAQWNWDFGDGTTSSQQNPANGYTNDGTYSATLEVTTNNGCSDEVTKNITVHPLPEVSFNGVGLEGCSPICPQINSTSVINLPATIDNSEWSLSDGSAYSGPSLSDCFENLSGSSQYYDLTLTVTSNEGCVGTHSENDYISLHHNPIAGFYYEPEEPSVIENEVDFFNTSLYADNYEWFFDVNGTSTDMNPSHEFPAEHGQHQVMLVAKTLENCADTLVEIIDVLDKIIFYVPNTFTPDNNKFNEVFQPIFTSGFEAQEFIMQIFNRWGELVFQSNDASKGWDGTYGLKRGEPVKEGTYVWKINFKETMSDKNHTHTGHVNLLK